MKHCYFLFKLINRIHSVKLNDGKNSDSFELRTCPCAVWPLGGAVGPFYSAETSRPPAACWMNVVISPVGPGPPTHTPAITGWRIVSALFNLSARLEQKTERDEPKHRLNKTGCNKLIAEQNVSKNKRDLV